MQGTSPPVTLVVFDAGGVLVRIRPWAEAHRFCGFGPDRLPPQDEFLPRLSLLNQAFDRGELEPDDYDAKVADIAGGRYLQGDVRRIHAAVSAEEFAGLHAVFDALDAGGVATGILSNTNVLHWQRLSGASDGGREYSLIQRATHAHASFLLKCAKPDPQIYDTFARAAAAHPSEILFFDDLERNVEAARVAGWRAEQVDHRVPVAPQLRAALRVHGVLD